MIRLLVYNWIPFDEKELKGGGVTVYTKNLIGCLCENPNYDIYFLSSGRAYNKNRADVYIEETDNIYSPNCKSYQVVNSPVLAPAALSFPYSQDYLYDYELKNVLKDFIDKNRFNVIHFQNLEGLSLGVFELKEDFPNIKFVYSVHNYFAICPQVMLWENDSNNCKHENCGEHCIYCMNTDVFKRKVIINQEIDYNRCKGREIDNVQRNKQAYLADFYKNKNFIQMQSIESKKHLIDVFSKYRKMNVDYINLYFDKILAVSNRVAEIIEKNGIDKNKLKVSYIGTKIAEKQCMALKNKYQGGIFHLCYLGYMRRMKGFYFLLDALETLPNDVATNISITFATKITDNDVKKRIKNIEKRLFSVNIIDGYTHEQLPEILENVNLGIVPPLWEDNLPQVAIEFKASGIPVLCSNLGGAKELAGSDDFVFEAGNTNDFISKLIYLIKNPKLLNNYWKGTPMLTTMQVHMNEIMKIYEGK